MNIKLLSTKLILGLSIVRLWAWHITLNDKGNESLWMGLTALRHLWLNRTSFKTCVWCISVIYTNLSHIPCCQLSNYLLSNYCVPRIDCKLKSHHLGEWSHLKGLIKLTISCQQAQLPPVRNVTVCPQKWLACSPPWRDGRVAFAVLIIHKYTMKNPLFPSMGRCQCYP